MELQELNKLFKNLNDLRVGKNLISKTRRDEDDIIVFEVYKLDSSDLYVQLKIQEDSYGENEYIAGIQFVKPTEKTIQVFETR